MSAPTKFPTIVVTIKYQYVIIYCLIREVQKAIAGHSVILKSTPIK